MSRDADITFTFTREVKVQEFMRVVLDAGWIPDDHGVIRYLVDPDMCDWSTAELDNLAFVVAELERRRVSGSSCAVMLTWGDTAIGGMFMFTADGSLMLTPVINAVTRQGFDNLVDFEWYLQRLLGALAEVGFAGYVITDMP
ncbi:hypothetical protein [Streptomyces sp. NPDC007883]|uniref:hypothetical protein n=1 Tax=Streptomyces sp. NPDC007883 TaxID=3155116 RepID=UPI0033F076E4